MSLTQQDDWNNCDTIQDVIFALCDDPDFAWKSTANQAAFETHIANCPECQAYRIDIETSIAGLRQLKDTIEAPDANIIADRVISTLNMPLVPINTPDNVVPLKRNAHLKHWSSIAAAVVLLLFSIPLMHFPTQQQTQPASTTLSEQYSSQESDLLASTLVDDHYLSPFISEGTDNNDDPIKVFVGF